MGQGRKGRKAQGSGAEWLALGNSEGGTELPYRAAIPLTRKGAATSGPVKNLQSDAQRHGSALEVPGLGRGVGRSILGVLLQAKEGFPRETA